MGFYFVYLFSPIFCLLTIRVDSTTSVRGHPDRGSRCRQRAKMDWSRSKEANTIMDVHAYVRIKSCIDSTYHNWQASCNRSANSRISFPGLFCAAFQVCCTHVAPTDGRPDGLGSLDGGKSSTYSMKSEFNFTPRVASSWLAGKSINSLFLRRQAGKSSS